MQQPIDIIVLTHNRLKYLYQMITALIQKTRTAVRLTVVDNASTESGMIEYLRSLYEEGIIYQLIENKENLWHRGWHQGILRTQSDPFILSDPDIIVPRANPCWLSNMLECYGRYPEYARIGLLLHTRNHLLNSNRCLDIRKHDVRPKTGKDDEITDAWLDTTMQLVDRRVYMMTNGFRSKEPGPCLQEMVKLGYRCGYYNRMAGLHLGWSEWRDYPEYLVTKNRESHWMHYQELELLNRGRQACVSTLV